jgi:hypothetical protein
MPLIPIIACKTDSWLVQLSILQAGIGTRKLLMVSMVSVRVQNETIHIAKFETSLR